MSDAATAFRAIATRFAIEGRLLSAAPYGNGHINDTLCTVWEVAGATRRFIHQRLNATVFPDPAAVMRNIERVCAHLANGDERTSLRLVPDRDGQPVVIDATGRWWRCYPFIEGSMCRERAADPAEAAAAARCYGGFIARLASLPGPPLAETIARFHDTPHRLAQLRAAVAADRAGRTAGCQGEIAFALKRTALAALIAPRLADGRLPSRAVHNDTKLNNVLFDAATGAGLCVIDLDTLMPGSPLYDLSDLLRTTMSSGAEDEADPGTIDVRLDVVAAVVDGFRAGLGGALTVEERALLPAAVPLMAFECGVRFLADHLAGDVYFRVHQPEHNLRRARAQFALVAACERRADDLARLI